MSRIRLATKHDRLLIVLEILILRQIVDRLPPYRRHFFSRSLSLEMLAIVYSLWMSSHYYSRPCLHMMYLCMKFLEYCFLNIEYFAAVQILMYFVIHLVRLKVHRFHLIVNL